MNIEQVERLLVEAQEQPVCKGSLGVKATNEVMNITNYDVDTIAVVLEAAAASLSTLLNPLKEDSPLIKPESLILSGGAIASLIQKDIPEDFDLYVAPQLLEAISIITSEWNWVQPNGITKTPNALSFDVQTPRGVCSVQLVLRNSAPYHLRTFDLIHCMNSAYLGESGEVKFRYNTVPGPSTTAYASNIMAHRKRLVPTSCKAPGGASAVNTYLRIAKLIDKGYTISDEHLGVVLDQMDSEVRDSIARDRIIREHYALS